MLPLRVIVTAGPSYASLDGVRRLTNQSTGELGTLLAERFAANDHRVLCLRGEGSTFPSPLWGVEVAPFSTNESLQAALEKVVAREDVHFIFHAAALCDYTVREIKNDAGELLTAGKVSSRGGAIHITLEPAPKLIAGLRKLYPATILVGWKYELEGTRATVLDQARKQIDDCLSDACVVNGPGYGSGYGVVSREGEKAHLVDKPALCRFLVEWAEHLPLSGTTPRQESFHALASFMPMAPFI